MVDGSFFVSSGAVNSTLTIVANALRVGDHLRERLRAGRSQAQSRADLTVPAAAALTGV